MADYATLLRDQVTLTCRSVDRIFLQLLAVAARVPDPVVRGVRQDRRRVREGHPPLRRDSRGPVVHFARVRTKKCSPVR